MKRQAGPTHRDRQIAQKIHTHGRHSNETHHASAASNHRKARHGQPHSTNQQANNQPTINKIIFPRIMTAIAIGGITSTTVHRTRRFRYHVKKKPMVAEPKNDATMTRKTMVAEPTGSEAGPKILSQFAFRYLFFGCSKGFWAQQGAGQAPRGHARHAQAR